MAASVAPELRFDASYDSASDTVTLGGGGILQGEATYALPIWDNVVMTANVKWDVVAPALAGDAEFMVYVGNDDYDGFCVTFKNGGASMYYENTQVGSTVTFALPSSPTPAVFSLTLRNKTATVFWGSTMLFDAVSYPMWDGQLWDNSKVGFWMKPALLTQVRCTVANVAVTNVMRFGVPTWVANDLLVDGDVLASSDVVTQGAVDTGTGVKTAGVVRMTGTGALTNVTMDAGSLTGTVAAARIPDIGAEKITSGVVSTARLPPASTTAVGVVQLSDSTTTASSVLAATSTAVKTVWDSLGSMVFGATQIPNLDTSKITTGTMAAARLPAATTLAAGVAQLSDSTSTTSSAIAATCTAVKTVWDSLGSRVFTAAQIPSLDASKITTGTIAAARLPAATTLAAGVAQLSDSTTTTSSTIAATCTAVKAVWDSLGSRVFTAAQIPALDAAKITTGTIAAARLPTATTLAAGSVQLSDSTTTTSSVIAATSTAIKTVWDALGSRVFTAAQIPSLDASKVTTGTLATARLPAASTTAAGVVQLSDSATAISSTTAATSTAVRTAWELANNALPKAGGAIGDSLIVFKNVALAADQNALTYIGWGGTAIRGIYHTSQTLLNISGPAFVVTVYMPNNISGYQYRAFVEFHTVDLPGNLSSFAAVPKFTYSTQHNNTSIQVNAHMTIVEKDAFNVDRIVPLTYWGFRTDVHCFLVSY